jgi:hypothetical protein
MNILSKSFTLSLAVAAAWLLPGAGTAEAARHALLIGVAEYEQPEANLRFPEKDVAAMKKHLMEQHGFEESEMRILLSSEATAAAMKREFSALVARTQPGDTVVFYVSSHGSQVEDTDGDEIDGMDETLCPYDFSFQSVDTHFTDDYIREQLNQLKTHRCLLIMDCCHSGTGTRTGGNLAKDGIKMIPSPFHPGPPQAVRGSLGASMKSIVRSGNNMKHLLIAGCAADEYSYEIPSIGGGLLTQAFINNGQGENLDRPVGLAGAVVQKQVADWVSQYIPDRKMQNVQVEGSLEGTLRELLRKDAPKIEVVAPPAMNPAAAGGREVLLTLATDKKTYLAGEKMRVTVTPDRECHLRLYYTDHNGESYLIFPNKFQQQDRIGGAKSVVIGGEDAPFAFEMTFPENFDGNEVGEILTAVASPVPFTDKIEAWDKTQFMELGKIQRGSLSTRGVQVRQRPGYAVASYLIQPKQ